MTIPHLHVTEKILKLPICTMAVTPVQASASECKWGPPPHTTPAPQRQGTKQTDSEVRNAVTTVLPYRLCHARSLRASANGRGSATKEIRHTVKISENQCCD